MVTTFKLPSMSEHSDDVEAFLAAADTAALAAAIQAAEVAVTAVCAVATQTGVAPETLNAHYGTINKALRHAQGHMVCVTILSVQRCKAYVNKGEVPPKMTQVLDKALLSISNHCLDIPPALNLLAQEMAAAAK